MNIINKNQMHTFESTFSKELSSILMELLTVDNIFLKFILLNKNFYSMVQQLKQYPKLWKIKYL